MIRRGLVLALLAVASALLAVAYRAAAAELLVGRMLGLCS